MDGYRLSAIGLSAMFEELPRNAGDDDTVFVVTTSASQHFASKNCPATQGMMTSNWLKL